MTTTANLTKVEMPEIFEVFFYTRPKSTSLADFLFNKGNADYHRVFDYSGSVVHVSVRLGAFVYEVTDQGTEKYPWQPELLNDERMVGYYTLDIKDFARDKKIAAVFTLENCIGRKLDIKGCLRYMWQCLGFGKSQQAKEYMATYSSQNTISLPPGTYLKKGRKEYFHLPFTCATLVNIVLNRLFDFEPSFTGHLAQSAALSLTIFSEVGWGSVYDLVSEEWITENG